jgi:SAM-dependent methyltransferase
VRTAPINTTMDRDDLLTEEGAAFVRELDALTQELERRRLPVTSWYGGLPQPGFRLSAAGLRTLLKRLRRGRRDIGTTDFVNRGGRHYEPVPGISNDDRHPWFLYWEAYWATRRGPQLAPGARVLDAGGTASLFSNYLASHGVETYSIDLNPRLVEAGRTTAEAMGWKLRSYSMDMAKLDFADGFFDHAYSICVFEHLEAELRQRALREIARVLKPGGSSRLPSITAPPPCTWPVPVPARTPSTLSARRTMWRGTSSAATPWSRSEGRCSRTTASATWRCRGIRGSVIPSGQCFCGGSERRRGANRDISSR